MIRCHNTREDCGLPHREHGLDGGEVGGHGVFALRGLRLIQYTAGSSVVSYLPRWVGQLQRMVAIPYERCAARSRVIRYALQLMSPPASEPDGAKD